ncbi:(2Fe-2S)-binding protein [Radiobacillus kanasensis]|uniref:(2Fe-2S)-binding protein n=1 Tax=Radiobacillus kanasensis TaxID=2844358 RepID=UPI001E319DA6|nr:(2Fe-2S)-binding protein [Radiobacillus kanasensis]UFT98826.1 (2Fe-2S)-binding protein [Radiobacillus kanasensis]
MSSLRITKHPVLDIDREQIEIEFQFNNKTYMAYQGDTIASALLANGIRNLRVHEETGAPRGIYCNIGHCFECRVTVDGQEGYRACLTLVTNGMVVQSGQKLPTPFKKTEREMNHG